MSGIEHLPANAAVQEDGSSEMPVKLAVMGYEDPEYIKANEEPTSVLDKPIKPTAKRRKAPTGFVRGDDTGKPKWSLFPPHLWETNGPEKYHFLGEAVASFLMGGGSHQLKKAFVNLLTMHPEAIVHMSDRYAKGADMFGLANWALCEKVSVFLDSMGRHLATLNDTDEDHLGAFLWNMSNMIHVLQLINRGTLPQEYNDVANYASQAKKGLDAARASGYIPPEPEKDEC